MKKVYQESLGRTKGFCHPERSASEVEGPLSATDSKLTTKL